MGHPSSNCGQSTGAQLGHPPPIYGPTEMSTLLLTILPAEAVIATVPLVVLPVTSVTTPPVTVARFVLLEVHVATLVMSSEPLQVNAVAVNVSLGLLPVKVNGLALDGCT